MNIRLSTAHDLPAIEALHHAAFGAEESAAIIQLVDDFLLAQPEVSGDDESVFSWVAEDKDTGWLLGHVIFSPVNLASVNPDNAAKESQVKAAILAPLAVLPAKQKAGVGTALVQYGLDDLKKQGVGFVFVYGDPTYYARFGFVSEQAVEYFQAPYPLEYPHGWHYLSLNNVQLPENPLQLACAPPLQKPELW